jgi:BNR repeat-containing family member
LHMVSYYDHNTGKVPRPTILLNKHTDDAHDNPTLMVDDQGFIWIFSPSHGTARPSYIHRSKKPYSIEDFERITVTNFSYPQPWWLPGKGFLFLHTRYADGRNLFSMASKDGRQWSEPQRLGKIEMGDYQISWRNGNRLATAFDFHPKPLGLNGRANIYYLETSDCGNTWTTADGKAVELPLTQTNNAALIYDSRKEGLLVYLKDIAFDASGNPVILFLTSKGYESGPKNNPRTWKTARWTGKSWDFKTFNTSDSNYDHGSLYIEPDGTWRIIAPTEPGPQPYNPGGEIIMWTSDDLGNSWKKVRQLTRNSVRNHTYARKPVNAHPDFYAFWADGNPRQPSESSLYFTNQKGDHVWRLPEKMTEDFATPAWAW